MNNDYIQEAKIYKKHDEYMAISLKDQKTLKFKTSFILGHYTPLLLLFLYINKVKKKKKRSYNSV